MSNEAAIYSLEDPSTGEVRYIGKANDPAKRLASHMRDSTRRNTPVYCWIRSLPCAPVMRILEVAEDWKEAEKRLIALHAGPRLLNLAEGGDQPSNTLEQLRARGLELNARLRADPKAKRIRLLKAQLMRYYGEVKDDPVRGPVWREKLHSLYVKHPRLFGLWGGFSTKQVAAVGS